MYIGYCHTMDGPPNLRCPDRRTVYSSHRVSTAGLSMTSQMLLQGPSVESQVVLPSHKRCTPSMQFKRTFLDC